MNILQEADSIIHGQRNSDYGSPLENHSLTAELFGAYLSRKKGPITARDICWFNILQKCSRDVSKPLRDNLVDTAGYAGNMEMIEDELAGHFKENVV